MITMRRKSILNAVAALATMGAGALTGLLAAQAGSAAPADVVSRCSDLPALWSGAHEVEYDAVRDTMRLVWSLNDDEVEASVAIQGADCESQPGLREFAANLKAGAQQTALGSCLDLKELVAVVRERDPKATGRAQVPSGADAEVQRRRVGEGAEEATAPGAAEALRDREASAARVIDLDVADAIIASNCP